MATSVSNMRLSMHNDMYLSNIFRIKKHLGHTIHYSSNGDLAFIIHNCPYSHVPRFTFVQQYGSMDEADRGIYIFPDAFTQDDIDNLEFRYNGIHNVKYYWEKHGSYGYGNMDDGHMWMQHIKALYMLVQHM
jgi:hypothetical protein